MLFSSIIFVFVFLPIALIGYFLLYIIFRNHPIGTTVGNAFLLIVSLIFYAWGGVEDVPIIIFSIFINYLFGLAINFKYASFRNSSRINLAVLICGIAINLCLLGYFKYMNFFAGYLLILNHLLPVHLNIALPEHVKLPLGISFYTFQGLSYLVDVYRKQVLPTRSLIRFGCSLTIFPHLVAGPIIRFANIQADLINRHCSAERFAQGTSRFIIGFAKKLLIADTLGRVADAAFSIPTDQLNFLAAWAGLICYTLQIYYDFSGYSDMAIGMGNMLGIKFPENFNYPYISCSIREFWRRWHMTLSLWFRDYLYFPLGGNRHGIFRTALNLFIVFTLCGLWHGASEIFVIWGLYHGLFLVLERILKRALESTPRFIQHFYTMTVVAIGWLIFRSSDLSQMKGYFKALTWYYSPIGGVGVNKVWLRLFAGDVYLSVIIGILGALPLVPWLNEHFNDILSKANARTTILLESGKIMFLLALFGVSLMPLFGATDNAFIYFRF